MNTTSLNHYDNSWFRKQIGASRSKQFAWYFTNILFFMNPLNPSSALKIHILKIFGSKLGQGTIIKPGVNIKYPWKLIIGDHCWIGEKVWIDNLAVVEMGNNVCISQGAMLLTGNHDYKSPKFDLIVKPILLMDGAWVGAKGLVGPGVTIESHAVLAAMSVANKDLSAYTIYQGNPAIAVRQRIISN
ncbi:MAG: colanic acid biosynthesis acetyltransferase WcaF [Chitinophagaceae bacterium]|nr:colanic acid biosynthesis acetyltransferase WcaF [Chitinophagaceae bacterium]